jgi:hypothetical protein
MARNSTVLSGLRPAHSAPCPGESVRWKTVRRHWLGSGEGLLPLIALTDEATGQTLARLTLEDSVEENLQALRRYVAAWGRPLRVRTDRSNLFGGVQGPREYGSRQIRRALAELDIEWMPAESPRDIGLSRLFFEQAANSFIRELTSASVRTVEGAARYLDSVYLPEWNAGIPPEAGSGRHRPLLAGQDLDSIFSIVEIRRSSAGGTIRFNGGSYRVMDVTAATALVGREIRIERRTDGKIVARWNEKDLNLKPIEKHDIPAGKHSSAAPRKPRSWNRAWMTGFFAQPAPPLWKLFR